MPFSIWRLLILNGNPIYSKLRLIFKLIFFNPSLNCLPLISEALNTGNTVGRNGIDSLISLRQYMQL